jgi:hypothetical protein
VCTKCVSAHLVRVPFCIMLTEWILSLLITCERLDLISRFLRFLWSSSWSILTSILVLDNRCFCYFFL